jgi:3-hydroxyacyl-[acyl-carrier-protein] dehydratase
MRFLMIDRVVELEPGRRIRAVKAWSLADEALRSHFGRRALVPAALLLETLAQTLGRLVIATHGHRVGVLLTVVEEASLVHDLAPGCLLDVEGELLGTSPRGSLGRARARAGGRTVAEAGRIVYGHVPHPEPEALRARLELAPSPEGGA